MTETILNAMLTENWALAASLFVVLLWVWFFIYVIFKKSFKLLEEFLKWVLWEIKEIVASLKCLNDNDNTQQGWILELQKKTIEEHIKREKEHNLIIDLLNKIKND